MIRITCLRAVTLLKEKYGYITAFLFIIGCISILGNSSTTEKISTVTNNSSKEKEFKHPDSLSKTEPYLLKYTFLEKSFTNSIELRIRYGKALDDKTIIPISANTSINGFVNGTNWVLEQASITKTNDNNSFKYDILGVIEWKFLGITIYHQPKTYTGEITLP